MMPAVTAAGADQEALTTVPHSIADGTAADAPQIGQRTHGRMRHLRQQFCKAPRNIINTN